jgi:capsular polysaccharide biosynthesis protein
VPYQTQEASVFADDMPQDEPRRTATVGLVAALLLVVLLAGASGLGAAALERQRPKHYVSQAVLLIDQEPALTTSHDSGIFDKLARLRVKYADIVRTTTFAERVSAKTGIGAGRVHASLSTQLTPVSLLLAVQSTDRDAETARAVAQGAAESLQEALTEEQAGLQIKVEDRVTLTIVSPASGAAKIGPTRNRIIAVGAIVALAVLGVGVIVVGALRRRTTA